MTNWARRMALLLGWAVWLAVLPAGVMAAEKKPVRVGTAEVELATSLKERELAVEAKEKDLARREADLAALRKDVDAKLARLTVLQGDLQARLAALQQVADKDFKNLVKVYSAMSPTKMAPLLDEMDDATVTRILKAMKADLVAKIIPKLEKSKAVRVSRQLGMLK
ncbi:MAG: hypothetical protein OEV91_11595 [Desulfobulbaceae bacterium]|nr:hypothetical protein [Desulfobulbaceae bacterium]